MFGRKFDWSEWSFFPYPEFKKNHCGFTLITWVFSICQDNFFDLKDSEIANFMKGIAETLINAVIPKNYCKFKSAEQLHVFTNSLSNLDLNKKKDQINF